MRRFPYHLALTALALSLGVGVAQAQLYNVPVFFSPAFGTGVGVFGDFGMGLNDDAKFGADAPLAFGGHVIVGLSKFQIMGGATYVDTKTTTFDKELSFGGNIALTLFRTPASMVVVNVQAGAGYAKFGTGADEYKELNFPIGVGLALNPPLVGAIVEPWIAPRAHIFRQTLAGTSQTEVGFGVSGGVNASLLLGIGAWAAVDWLTIKPEGATESLTPFVLGAGLSWKFSVPSLGIPGGIIGG
ncbi:MAG: hypothetical protein JSW43_12145 [Gemmatimonadota bacterium]|nr:MAG: hypothetical protein JSW43_12145 [Gemmatimonadota bacterium]